MEATEDSFPVSELNKLPKGELHRSDESKQKLKEDISKNGIKEPLTLVYYVKDNALRLKEGHHRLDAANKLGIKDIPVKVQVEWNKSIKEDSDIQGQKLYHPPHPLDVDIYKKRNYQPSNIELNELGFKEKSIKGTDKTEAKFTVDGEDYTPKTETSDVAKKAVEMYYDVKDAEGTTKARKAAKERREFLKENPSFKEIDDNISDIYKQLEQKGLLEKRGDCP